MIISRLNVCPNNHLWAESGGSLHFIFSYASPVVHRYKQRTVQETWIHLIQKIWPESMHCLREAIPCYWNRELTPTVVSEKNWNTKENKGKSMMHSLYVLRLAKRHISGWSDIKQWRNQAHNHVLIVELHLAEGISEWVSEWVSE